MELKKDILYEINLKDQDEDMFDVGYFISRDEENLVFQSVNVNGFDDGLLLVKTSNIQRLLFKTKYCEGMEKLIKFKGVKFITPNLDGKNLVNELLNYAKKNNSIVGIELNNSGVIDLIGFVEDITDDTVTTQEINTDGQADGKALAMINDISEISIDAYRNLKRKILFEINYSKS